MGRKLQAYFLTENDAEDVRIRLQGYGVRHLEVGKLDSPYSGVPLLFPIFGVAGNNGTGIGNGSVTGTGTNAGAGAVAAGVAGMEGRGIFGLADDADDHNDHIHEDSHGHVDYGDLHYTLTADVVPEDYDRVVDLIRRNNGHVEVFD